MSHEAISIKNIEFIEIHVKGATEPLFISRAEKTFTCIISFPPQSDPTDNEAEPSPNQRPNLSIS
jgi:hypothetical protein